MQKRFSGINFTKMQAVESYELTCRMAQLDVCNCLISRADLLNLTSKANRDEQWLGVVPKGVRPFQAVFLEQQQTNHVGPWFCAFRVHE